MGTEYHHRIIARRRHSWDVARLRALAAGIEVHSVPLSSIVEYESVYWFDAEYPPTCRAVAEHAERIARADLTDPILMSADGYVIDGMHRVARAHLEGLECIEAVTLGEYPEPDLVAGG